NIALEGGANARAIISLYNDTALIAAAHRGHVEIVRALIAASAPLNHVNDLGRTALLEAVVLGNGGTKHTATVEALVKTGADVTLPDRHGTTALQHARTRGYSQIARILEQAGAHLAVRSSGGNATPPPPGFVLPCTSFDLCNC